MDDQLGGSSLPPPPVRPGGPWSPSEGAGQPPSGRWPTSARLVTGGLVVLLGIVTVGAVGGSGSDGEQRALAVSAPARRSSPATTASTTTTSTTTSTTTTPPTTVAPTTAPPTTPAPTLPPPTAPPVTQPLYAAPVVPSAYYENCDAARAAGAAPLHTGDPGYRAGLDRDSDGVACE